MVIFQVAAHVSCCNYPPEWALKNLWQQNKDSLLSFIHAAHQGNGIEEMQKVLKDVSHILLHFTFESLATYGLENTQIS